VWIAPVFLAGTGIISNNLNHQARIDRRREQIALLFKDNFKQTQSTQGGPLSATSRLL